VILPISASKVAGIIDVSHWYMVSSVVFKMKERNKRRKLWLKERSGLIKMILGFQQSKNLF
jgi:hypothetical protein